MAEKLLNPWSGKKKPKGYWSMETDYWSWSWLFYINMTEMYIKNNQTSYKWI